jgi:hypothetical protein
LHVFRVKSANILLFNRLARQGRGGVYIVEFQVS